MVRIQLRCRDAAGPGSSDERSTMTDFARSKQDLDASLTASIPLIGIRSSEQYRALDLVREVSLDSRRSSQAFTLYTRSKGLRDLRSEGVVSDDRSLAGALDYAAAQFATRSRSVMVVVDPEEVAEDTSYSRHFLELARAAGESSSCLVIITDGPLWPPLAREGQIITLDLPTADEMYQLIDETFKHYAHRVPIQWTAEHAKTAADTLVGVSRTEAQNMLARLLAPKFTAGSPLAVEDLGQLIRYKDASFADLAGLEKVRIRPGELGVAGLENLKHWLGKNKRKIMQDWTGTAFRPPRGVLLVGVPGCGKSLSAKTIALDWELPLYRLDLATIQGQYVGQSEGRLREALDTAERVSPCILWIDEIEKGLAGGGADNDSGVTRKMVGQFLFWLQESRAKCFVVATANDVRSLPPELLRKGRFDKMFFIDLPTEQERREIVMMYAGRYFRQTRLTDEQTAHLVSISDGFSGSDIEAVMHSYGGDLVSEPSQAWDFEQLVAEFKDTRPLSRTSPERITEIRDWGRDRCEPAGVRAPVIGRQMGVGRLPVV